MKKYFLLGLFIFLVISIGLVTALGIEKMPAIVLSSGKRIAVPQQAIDSSLVIEENNLIVPTTSEIDKIIFRLRGCQILHELNDATALRCPEGMKIQNARLDRIFKFHDLEADNQINADDVWALGYDGSGVKIAILDTGVDDEHIELSDSILANKNFIKGPGFDRTGHGTHVSGIVTANGIYQINNNYATGVAPGADIIVGKVCNNAGCYESAIMAGIEWAVAEGADVLSLSLGGGNFGSHCDNDPLAAKVNWAVSQGLVVIVSAGNEKAGVSSPACASGAIAVGATYHKNYAENKVWYNLDGSIFCQDTTPVPDDRVCWSNYGDALDLMAPGVDILSTYSCKAAGDCGSYWYAYMSGTSMSAPHVAGAAALILQKNPDYTVDDVKEALYNTAVDLGTVGWDQYNGYGRVDALAAVTYNPVPVDNDGDGYTSDVDCNDNNPNIYPGATEVCNGVDDNCNYLIDEGFDLDGDGYTTCGGDCNDNDETIHPGADETVCDGVDNDCDSEVDENYASYTCGLGACESYSVCENAIESCTPGTPTEEVCGDLIDNDCDGEVDEGCEPTAFCGDKVCAGYMEGEDCFTCPEDCRCTGKWCSRACCGNGICKNENMHNCPVDCA